LYEIKTRELTDELGGFNVPLAFLLLANKHQSPMRTYSDIEHRRLQNFVRMFFNIVYADFETAIPNAVTAVLPGCEVTLYYYCPYRCVISKFSLCTQSNTTRQIVNVRVRPEDGNNMSRNMPPM
jgi:hypothetical protein